MCANCTTADGSFAARTSFGDTCLPDIFSHDHCVSGPWFVIWLREAFLLDDPAFVIPSSSALARVAACSGPTLRPSNFSVFHFSKSSLLRIVLACMILWPRPTVCSPVLFLNPRHVPSMNLGWLFVTLLKVSV